mmetsp:Transcript_112910/g.211716  ORF Transcript_112910/g.211716 Transcript_112910/m.211716 type:complete len:84 (-) Transcript_112910:1047-1298(-)
MGLSMATRHPALPRTQRPPMKGLGQPASAKEHIPLQLNARAHREAALPQAPEELGHGRRRSVGPRIPAPAAALRKRFHPGGGH